MSESFVTVATFETPAEAQLARNRPEEEGIDLVLTDVETAPRSTGLSASV
jgi:hypothetical protein